MFRTDLLAGKRFPISGDGACPGRIRLERFVELGADCVICGRHGDVLDETAVEEMIDRIPATGPLDGLVNNATGNLISQTKDLSARAFDAIVTIGLHGTFYMTNACGKRRIAEKRKASIFGFFPTWVWR